MKHSELQIKEKAHQIIKDLRGKYYFENCINNVVFDKNDIISFGKLQGQKHPTWTIGVKAVFDNLDLLLISDETSEPLYYQNFNTIVFDLEKDKEGKYSKKEI